MNTNKLFRIDFFLIAFMIAYMSLGLWEDNLVRDKFNDGYAHSFYCDTNPLNCNEFIYFKYYPSNDTEQSFKDFKAEQPLTFRTQYKRYLLLSFFPLLIMWFFWVNKDLIEIGYQQYKFLKAIK